jgi:hypothetical protein
MLVPVFRVKLQCLGNCSDGAGKTGAVTVADQKYDGWEDENSEDEEEVEEEDDEDNEDNEEENDRDEAKGDHNVDQQLDVSAVAKKTRPSHLRRKCPNRVVLHVSVHYSVVCSFGSNLFQVEVLSDDLTQAVIYRRNTHNPTDHRYLDMSHYIRQNIMELSSLAADMTAGRIKRSESLHHLAEPSEFHQNTQDCLLYSIS